MRQMGTQGLVTVMRGDHVLMKVVAGTGGGAAAELAEAIAEQWPLSASSVYELAMRNDFGGREDLVVIECDQVMDPRFTEGKKVVLMGGPVVFRGDGEVPSKYRETFLDPDFNPRWEDGSADHKMRVQVTQPVVVTLDEASEKYRKRAEDAEQELAAIRVRFERFQVLVRAQHYGHTAVSEFVRDINSLLGDAADNQGGADCHWYKGRSRADRGAGVSMTTNCGRTGVRGGNKTDAVTCKECLVADPCECGHGKLWHRKFGACTYCDECPVYDAVLKTVMSGDRPLVEAMAHEDLAKRLWASYGRRYADMEDYPDFAGPWEKLTEEWREMFRTVALDLGAVVRFRISKGVQVAELITPERQAAVMKVLDEVSEGLGLVPKTTPVEIAVAVTGTKELGAAIVHDGDRSSARNFALELLGEESELEHVVFVQVDVPLPKEEVVEGSVVK